MARSILRRRVSWIAVLPVALLQLSIAAHQFEHGTEYAEDTCHVCVQLDRVDAAVDHSAERAPLLSNDFLRSITLSISSSRDSVRNFDSRAPPRL